MTGASPLGALLRWLRLPPPLGRQLGVNTRRGLRERQVVMHGAGLERRLVWTDTARNDQEAWWKSDF